MRPWLFAHHLQLLPKLWDRGVDIGVGVVTSLFVAGVGLLLWRVKLWLDLRADAAIRLQQNRMEDEHEAEKNQRVAREQYNRLIRERDDRIRVVLAAQEDVELAEHRDGYLRWLSANNLHHLPRNVAVAGKYANWSSSLRSGPRSNKEKLAGIVLQMEELIANTELPEQPD